MTGIIDEIKYLVCKIKNLDCEIGKVEDSLQAFKIERLLNLTETRKYDPKFHQKIVENLTREFAEINLQMLTNDGRLLEYQKKRFDCKRHLEELERQWRNQTQAKPQTPAGATVKEPVNTVKHQATAIPKEIYYDDKKGLLFVENDPVKLTHTEKVFFEYFWDKEEGVSNDAVIDHMTMFYELKGTTWNIGYFNKTKT
ncbi:MAG TPA: hypothetical protein VJ440_13700, partial [Candidatus Brocadiaceae bacterium]|nr:hypothetical protein [Candidatus Brocadiaceae bacterium]